jgi:hypothetical protein
MPANPLLRFHHTAEAAGYPALLIVSMFSLGVVVAPIALLALTRAAWTLVLALLGLIAAVILLAWEVDAALADHDHPGEVDQHGAVVAQGTTRPRRIA